MLWLQASEFDWSPELRGAILSSFFYGYISTQLIGGLLGAKIGGVKLIGYGVLCTAFLTILTPMAARYSVYLVIVLRVIEGVFEVWYINIYEERDSLYLLNLNLNLNSLYSGSRISWYTCRMVEMGAARRTHPTGIIRFFRQFCGHCFRIPFVRLVSRKIRLAIYVLRTRYVKIIIHLLRRHDNNGPNLII